MWKGGGTVSTYSPQHLSGDRWTVVDARGVRSISVPVSETAAQKIADRFNEESGRAKRASAPARIFWSDAASTSLMETMQTYDFVIPAKRQADWRAPRDEDGTRFRGSLPSLSIATATLLATDGIVAYFVLGDDKTLLYGHLAAFVEATESHGAFRANAVRKERGASAKSPKKSNVQLALDMLTAALEGK